jgi:hypothetical protein
MIKYLPESTTNFRWVYRVLHLGVHRRFVIDDTFDASFPFFGVHLLRIVSSTAHSAKLAGRGIKVCRIGHEPAKDSLIESSCSRKYHRTRSLSQQAPYVKSIKMLH